MFRLRHGNVPVHSCRALKEGGLVLFPVLVFKRFKSATTTPSPWAFVRFYDREVLALKFSIGIGSAGSLACYHSGENNRGYRPHHVFPKDGTVSQ